MPQWVIAYLLCLAAVALFMAALVGIAIFALTVGAKVYFLTLMGVLLFVVMPVGFYVNRKRQG